jgi:hypothetical protein
VSRVGAIRSSFAARTRWCEGGEQGGLQCVGGGGLGEASAVDFFGCGVHEAVEGGHEPASGQVTADGAFDLPLLDETVHTVQDSVVVFAHARDAQLVGGRGEQAAVAVQDAPGRADQLGERLAGGLAVRCLQLELQGLVGLVMAWAITASSSAWREGKWA